jgi:integrase/recombinase XerD
MRSHEPSVTPAFKSPFARLLDGFLAEKRACGYRYNRESRTLQDIDQFLLHEATMSCELPRELVQRWLASRLGEHRNSQSRRVGIMRQFAQYLLRQGIPAYSPHDGYIRRKRSGFVPRIFTFQEVRDFLHALDRYKPSPWSPRRHIIMPELFRLLYGCGLRVNEALRLLVKQVDLDAGVLNISNAKFGRDRIVPMPLSLLERLRRYQLRAGVRDANAYFFPAPDDGPYHYGTIYGVFRQTLTEIQIVHGGRGYGPRVHDFRHTFAVHRLIHWYREGANLSAKIPILATYLGHRDVTSTQKYLHLIPELFPEITKSLECSVGYVIPRRRQHETD